MLLVGKKAIADYCHVSIYTLDNWRKELAFPVVIGLNGKPCISTESIKLWMRAYLTVKRKKEIHRAKTRPPVQMVRVPQVGKVKVREAKISIATEKLKAKRWKPAGTLPPRAPLWNLREKKLSKNLNLSPEPPSDES